MKRKILVALSAIFAFVLFTAESCEPTTQQSNSITGASSIKESFDIPKNSKGNTIEQEQILERVKRTSDPTKILWIHIIALDGHIIFRNPVRCKVSSSGKRLQPTHAVVESQNSGGDFPPVPGSPGVLTDELLQADGTYGSSDAYIFWFDPQDRYHQKGEGYLLTDYPIDLDNPIDKITGLYNAQLAASKWQKEQEEILKQQQNH